MVVLIVAIGINIKSAKWPVQPKAHAGMILSLLECFLCVSNDVYWLYIKNEVVKCSTKK